ncbi:MAG: transglutaminase-like domain-containing protein [Candidatus Cloacimonetes bacterium]|nr:transglutaminase-like domain-containing protein [Candidatus Cloacimonadota bacterium]
MRKLFILLILLTLTNSIFAELNTDRISRYAGKNADELLELLQTTPADTLEYLEFILENCAATDLAILRSDYLMDNIRYALKSQEFAYTAGYDKSIFLHFVLPHRMSQEPLEDWRPAYYKELKPLVENLETIEEAAIKVNIWCLEQMTYKPTHGRDQSAFTSAKRGYGRCEEMMIIYMCAARAVGIPVRSCSAPYWNFTDSNHAWIEVWTPNGWKYLGEPASSLSKTWFTNTTQRATLITAKAFGNYEHKNSIKQEDNVTTLSSIEYYTDSYQCHIKVIDQSGEAAKEVTVMPMAVSFGGIWQMTDMTTDINGECMIPLGKGSTLIMAGKDSLCAWQMVTNLDGEDRYLSLTLSDDNTIDEDFSFLFPLPNSNPRDNEEPVFWAETFDLMRENADLKRKNRLNSQKQTAEFARYYDQVKTAENRDDEYYDSWKTWLDKADELAANADDFLHVLGQESESGQWVITEMIDTWDIKDLCEIPDSLALRDIVNIFTASRSRFGLPDTLFSQGCITRTWRSASPVQDGWQAEFYQNIVPLIDNELETTVQNIYNWIQESTEIEEDFVWTYYSSSITPPEILNLHYIPEFYQTKLLNTSLKLAGIPVRWEGQLEYYNGSDWLPAPSSAAEEETSSELRNFTLRIFVDGVEVKAEPYENFLVASLNADGYLYPTWFDGENDSLLYKGKYRVTDAETIHIEAAVRNSNGDATVAIRSLTQAEQEIKLDMTTPKEYLDMSTNWQETTLEAVRNIVTENPFAGKKIVMIRGRKSSEPENHTTRFLQEKLAKFTELNARLYIYSEKRSIRDLNGNKDLIDAILLDGKPILENELAAENYPALFVLDEENNLIFSTTGYNMGIADLIIKKLK